MREARRRIRLAWAALRYGEQAPAIRVEVPTAELIEAVRWALIGAGLYQGVGWLDQATSHELETVTTALALGRVARDVGLVRHRGGCVAKVRATGPTAAPSPEARLSTALQDAAAQGIDVAQETRAIERRVAAIEDKIRGQHHAVDADVTVGARS